MQPEPNRQLPTPEEYLKKMREEQGEEPLAWARTLASVVIFGMVPEEKAGAYVDVLTQASGKEAQGFLKIYNHAIEQWKNPQKPQLLSDS